MADSHRNLTFLPTSYNSILQCCKRGSAKNLPRFTAELIAISLMQKNPQLMCEIENPRKVIITRSINIFVHQVANNALLKQPNTEQTAYIEYSRE